MPRTHRPYPPEFRAEAVRLARGSDKSIPALAADLGVSSEALRHWLRQADADAGPGPARRPDDRRAGGAAPPAARESRPQAGAGDPAKSRGLLREGDLMSRYRFIHAEQATYPIAVLCRVLRRRPLGLLRLGAPRGLGPRPGRRGPDRADRRRPCAQPPDLRRAARPRRAAGRGRALRPQARGAADARGGPRRLPPPPARAHHGRRPGPHARAEPGRARLRGPGAGPPLARRHHVRADAGGLALPRRPAGRPLAPRGRLGDGRPPAHRAGARRARDGPRARAARRRASSITPTAGCQYTAAAYRHALAARGVVASMSRSGDCLDNAMAESFFATLKAELVDARTWPTRAAARTAIFEWIEVWYNRQRRHSALGYRPPVDVRGGRVVVVCSRRLALHCPCNRANLSHRIGS